MAHEIPRCSSPGKGDIKLFRAPGLVMVMETLRGRAVFASNGILAGTIVEVSPVLVLPINETKMIMDTALYHYTYNWPTKGVDGRMVQTQAVCLGLGSLFNHSSRQHNVEWTRDLARTSLIYRALRDIEPGEELCIHYGRLWFTEVEKDEVLEDQSTRNDLDSDNDFLNLIQI